MYVPTEKGNTTTILEPLTCSYPEYGKGGEHQLCVDFAIKFKNVEIINAIQLSIISVVFCHREPMFFMPKNFKNITKNS